MTIRRLLLRVPVLGRAFDRRWIPDTVRRAEHQEIVRGRLPGAAPSDPAPDPAERRELPGA